MGFYVSMAADINKCVSQKETTSSFFQPNMNIIHICGTQIVVTDFMVTINGINKHVTV